jgi:hypothetical protein
MDDSNPKSEPGEARTKCATQLFLRSEIENSADFQGCIAGVHDRLLPNRSNLPNDADRKIEDRKIEVRQ